MIKLPKRPTTPRGLMSAAVQRAKRKVRAQVAKGETKTFDSSLWLKDEVRRPLHDHHKRKCCYCERKRDLKREPDVEHFRPKAMVAEDKNHPGYWWLAYTWKNLYFSCRTCNQAFKKNYFPIAGQRARKPTDSLTKESPILLDPAVDDPKQHLHYHWEHGRVPVAKIVGLDERGRSTVKILGLDRDPLNAERGSLLLIFSGLVATMNYAIYSNNVVLQQQTEKHIRDTTSPTEEFAGFRREYFRKANLGHFVPWD